MKKKQNSNLEPEGPKYWESESFKTLQAKWYAKAAKAGHEEIEMGDLNSDNPYLRRWDSTWFVNRRHGPRGTLEQMEYFSQCTRILNERKFKTKFDFCVWECHTNGLTIVQTVQALKAKRFKNVTARTVKKSLVEVQTELFLELKRDPSSRN